MRSLIIVLFTICAVCGSTLPTKAEDEPAAIPRADAVTFLGTEIAASELVKNVFAVHVQGLPTIDGKPTWTSLGSGFLVAGPKVSETRYTTLGITCNHILDAASKLKKDIYIGLDTADGYQRLPVRILYIDAENDIAVIAPLQDIRKAVDIQNLAIPIELFDDGKSLVEGRGVLIIGYPLSLGTEDDKNHPVVRFGMIAQNTGKATFLIDGVTSHGNSGSPVFTLKINNNKLSGMATSFEQDNIALFDENQQVRAMLPYNSGLARAVRASIILKAITEATKKL